MNSVIDLGFISIHYYSIILFIAIIVGSQIAINEGKKWNIPENFMVNLLFWAIVFGIIGARIYYVAFNFDYYATNISEIFQVWKGGLAIHGGILGALIFISIYCNKYKVKLLRTLDIIVVGLILAQAIGRWGNFFNGEAHGPVTTLAHLQDLFIPQFIIDGMYINGSYYIPTFFFESIWCLIGFIILLFFRRRKYNKIGQTTSLYLIWYGIGRFFIESLRTDSLMLFDLKMAQFVSIGMIIIGIILMIIVSRGSKFENLYNDEENAEDVKFWYNHNRCRSCWNVSSSLFKKSRR